MRHRWTQLLVANAKFSVKFLRWIIKIKISFSIYYKYISEVKSKWVNIIQFASNYEYNGFPVSMIMKIHFIIFYYLLLNKLFTFCWCIGVKSTPKVENGLCSNLTLSVTVSLNGKGKTKWFSGLSPEHKWRGFMPGHVLQKSIIDLATRSHC